MSAEEADKPAENNTTEFGFHDRTLEVPTKWASRIDGLLGHVARYSLLSFVREIDAEEIHFVHGGQSASEEL